MYHDGQSQQHEKAHQHFQGKRDTYQSVLNSIVKKLGEKSRVLSLNNKGGFKNITSAHKELQKRYNKYQEIMSNQGWRAAEKYWNENLKNLAQESQFEVFTLADEALRNPALIKNDPAKYGMFADVVNEWKSISPRLYKDLLNGFKFHINAVKEVKQESNIAFLKENHIRKILSAYKNYQNEDGFCKVVSKEEVLEKRGNLNLSIYVSNNTAKDKILFEDALIDWKKSSYELKSNMEELFKDLN